MLQSALNMQFLHPWVHILEFNEKRRCLILLVGKRGFEPPTPASRTASPARNPCKYGCCQELAPTLVGAVGANYFKLLLAARHSMHMCLQFPFQRI
jgi:hypothetical protein